MRISWTTVSLLLFTVTPAYGQKSRPAPAPGVSLIQVLDKACQRGDSRACFVLGQKLMAGRGVAKDQKRGRQILSSACDKGHEQACAAVGRPVPYRAEIQVGVQAKLRLKRFDAISVGSFLGPDGDLLRTAFSGPLKEGCDCLVSYSEDLDLLGHGDLLIAGIVLDHRVSAAREPLDRVTQEKEEDLAALIPTTKAGQAGAKPATDPEQCTGSTITARLWLIHSGNRKAPPSLLIQGQGPAGSCSASIKGAVARLVQNTVAMLTNRFTRRVTLYKDPGLTELEAGNEHARTGAWASALDLYEAAFKAASERKLPAITLGHLQYSRGLALSGLGRYAEALATLRKARKINPDETYLLEMERLIAVESAGWAAPPPVEKKAAAKGKRRRLFWQPRLKRKIVWEK